MGRTIGDLELSRMADVEELLARNWRAPLEGEVQPSQERRQTQTLTESSSDRSNAARFMERLE